MKRREDHIFVCHQCGHVYNDRRSLVRHCKVHDDTVHVCQQCHKVFDTDYNLRRHIKTHESNASYECDDCGKSFTSKNYLRKHKSTHLALEFVCEKCKQVFSTKGNCDRHRRICHFTRKASPPVSPSVQNNTTETTDPLPGTSSVGQQNSKTYVCSLCGVTCRNKYMLIRHVGRYHATQDLL